jgi:hypothetical protein
MPWIVLTLSDAGVGERLAGISAVEHVDGFDVVGEVSDVGVDGNAGPVAFEHGVAVLVCFAEPGGLAFEGRVESEVEAADSCEEASCAEWSCFTASGRRSVRVLFLTAPL